MWKAMGDQAELRTSWPQIHAKGLARYRLRKSCDESKQFYTASPTRRIYVFSPCLSVLVLVFNLEDNCALFRAVYLVHTSRWSTLAKSRAIRGRTEQQLIHTSKD